MTPPVWPFLAYSLLTQAGLCLFGVIWLRAQRPRWPGWLMLGGTLFFFILMVIFGDMPPFVYYLLTLVAGVVLYRESRD